MLRTDGSLVSVDEDRFALDRIWMEAPGPGLIRYYFGWRTSIRQTLRLLDPSTPFRLQELFMWGGPNGSMSASDAPPMVTVGEALDWLAREVERGDLINLTCLVAESIEVSTHDDTEITLTGPLESETRSWAARLLESRGFQATELMACLERHHGKYLAIQQPSSVVGIYDSFDELHQAHPER